MSESFNSFEQAVECATYQIREKRGKILNDFALAYAAQLAHLEDFCLDDICLVEQLPSFRDGHMTTKYWFEHKPKFVEEDLDDY